MLESTAVGASRPTRPVQPSRRPRPRRGQRFDYRRREPEKTDLYRIVHEHLEEFLAHARETYARPLPKYVERELRDFLLCGQLSEGFTRVRCPRCRHEFLVAFSCGGRGVCPSCSSRRMAATAAHMADKVLPAVGVRQWVVSVPYAIRRLLAADASVLSAVLRIFLKVVTGWYEVEAKAAGVEGSKAGAVAFTQRFGGALNAHVHFHVVYLDGVFAEDEKGVPRFHAMRAPSQSEIASIASEVGRRVKKMLRRRGLVRDAPEQDDTGGEPPSAIEACMRVAQSAGSFERLDGVASVASPDDARFDHRKRSPWSAEADGFSVNAGVSMAAGDAEGRERLIRYCARPALSLKRLSLLPDGRIAYRGKYPKRGGRTHLVMTPLELLARIAALVPPPKIPSVRYSGVLAPASPWRASVVPTARQTACAHAASNHAKVDRPDAHPRRSVSDPSKTARSTKPAVSQPASRGPTDPTLVQQPSSRATAPSSQDKFRGRRSTSYVDWATLMKRSMGIDVLECPKCSARMQPIAVITEKEVIERILSHLRLPLRPVVGEDDTTVFCDVTGSRCSTRRGMRRRLTVASARRPTRGRAWTRQLRADSGRGA